jgi:hypothetical protein
VTAAVPTTQVEKATLDFEYKVREQRVFEVLHHVSTYIIRNLSEHNPTIFEYYFELK